MTQFEELMHQMLAHNPSFDPVFFTTQFLEGLKHEIRVGVMLHQPKDLDSVFSLATMQEELLEALPRREYRRQDALPVRAPPRPLLVMGAPPVRPLLQGPPAAAEDRRGQEAANAQERAARGDDRVAALRNYRRARGLCFKCGERWGQGHQCAATVQLHVVEELLELLQADCLAQPEQGDDSDDEVLMSISKVATTGQTTPHTVRLLGRVNGYEVLILVDSGSSHSFVSEQVTEKMQNQVKQLAPVTVKIADGGTLSCTGILPQCAWTTQGHTFISDLRVLSLGCYDMVVGMDWLEQCGPMWVDWTNKILQFKHQDKDISLTGIQPKLTSVPQVSVAQLRAMEAADDILHFVTVCAKAPNMSDTEKIPDEVQALLDEFAVVFQEPTQLPKQKAWDHAIPLLLGAKPVNIRPYRYTPEQKTEIEAQVCEMLKAGLITPSISPFSSPVLLVKKKDLTWRFCVDF